MKIQLVYIFLVDIFFDIIVYYFFLLFRNMTSLNLNSGLYSINHIRTILHVKNSGLLCMYFKGLKSTSVYL